MSRGPGRLQQYLLRLLYQHKAPMTFAEIMAIAKPHAETYRPHRERSLRRALKTMIDRGIVVEEGRGRRGDPGRFSINPAVIQATIDAM